MRITRIQKIAAVSIAIALIGGAAISIPASAATAATRYITVNSEGTVKVAPDAVRLNATVSIVGANSKSALAEASTASAAVRAALKTSGVDTKDIATQSLTVFPEYNYTQDKGQSLIGYRAAQSFVVSIRNAKSAGAIVDAVVAAGGDSMQVNGVTPFILDTTKATLSARSDAVKKAKAKATSYASLLGVKLGKVVYLTENSSPSNYVPMLAMAKSADTGATEVDLGQQDVTVGISVQWALLSPFK